MSFEPGNKDSDKIGTPFFDGVSNYDDFDVANAASDDNKEGAGQLFADKQNVQKDAGNEETADNQENIIEAENNKAPLSFDDILENIQKESEEEEEQEEDLESVVQMLVDGSGFDDGSILGGENHKKTDEENDSSNLEETETIQGDEELADEESESIVVESDEKTEAKASDEDAEKADIEENSGKEENEVEESGEEHLEEELHSEHEDPDDTNKPDEAIWKPVKFDLDDDLEDLIPTSKKEISSANSSSPSAFAQPSPFESSPTIFPASPKTKTKGLKIQLDPSKLKSGDSSKTPQKNVSGPNAQGKADLSADIQKAMLQDPFNTASEQPLQQSVIQRKSKAKNASSKMSTDDVICLVIASFEVIALVFAVFKHDLAFLTGIIGVIGLIAGAVFIYRNKARVSSKAAIAAFSLVTALISLFFVAASAGIFGTSEKNPTPSESQEQAAVEENDDEQDQEESPTVDAVSQLAWTLNPNDMKPNYETLSNSLMDHRIETHWNPTVNYNVTSNVLQISTASVVPAYGTEELQFDINVKYPEITSSTLDVAAANAVLVDAANEVSSIYYSPTDEMVAMRNISGGTNITANVDYTLVYNTPTLISIVFQGTIALGNASVERVYTKAMCVDLESGRVYTFDDALMMSEELAQAVVEFTRTNGDEGRWLVDTYGSEELASDFQESGELGSHMSRPMLYIDADGKIRIMATCALPISESTLRTIISCPISPDIQAFAAKSDCDLWSTAF